MNIHNKLQTSVPFASIKQGDLFWSHNIPCGLYIKLGKTDSSATQYPFNSYRVGVTMGGRNFYDEDMVWPVHDVTIS